MQPCGICLEATNCQETICCKQPICAACHDQWTLHSKRQSCAFCRVCSNPLVVKLGDHKYIVSGSEQTGQTIFLNAISADVSVTSLSVRFEDNKVRVEWMEKVDAELYLHRARNFRLEDNEVGGGPITLDAHTLVSEFKEWGQDQASLSMQLLVWSLTLPKKDPFPWGSRVVIESLLEGLEIRM